MECYSATRKKEIQSLANMGKTWGQYAKWDKQKKTNMVLYHLNIESKKFELRETE